MNRRTLIMITLALASAGLAAAHGFQDPPPVVPQDTRAESRRYLKEIMARYEGARSQTIERYLSSPRKIEAPLRGRLDPIVDKDESRLHSLQDRSNLRAYDGAPPVMPHSRNYIAQGECLDCHRTGIFLGSKFARPMSHARLLNCEQCHIESRNMFFDSHRIEQPNSFQGLPAPTGGMRASSVAPPVIPHTTFMRVNCLACHGPNGYRGLRTDHPQRLNCVQCHAVATSIDQSSPFYSGEPTLILPRVRSEDGSKRITLPPSSD